MPQTKLAKTLLSKPASVIAAMRSAKRAVTWLNLVSIHLRMQTDLRRDFCRIRPLGVAFAERRQGQFLLRYEPLVLFMIVAGFIAIPDISGNVSSVSNGEMRLGCGIFYLARI